MPFPNRAKYHVFEHTCGHQSESGGPAYHPPADYKASMQPCGLCGGALVGFTCPPGCPKAERVEAEPR